MIESLVKATEKFIELLQHRQRHRGSVYREVIAPLYAALEPVHRDYIEMLHGCMDRINGGEPLPAVHRVFQQDRKANEHLRRDLLAKARAFAADKSVGDQEPADFFLAMCVYLQSPVSHVQGATDREIMYSAACVYSVSASSVVERAVRRLTRAVLVLNDLGEADSPEHRAELIDLILDIEKHLSLRWNRLAACHAEAWRTSMRR